MITVTMTTPCLRVPQPGEFGDEAFQQAPMFSED